MKSFNLNFRTIDQSHFGQCTIPVCLQWSQKGWTLLWGIWKDWYGSSFGGRYISYGGNGHWGDEKTYAGERTRAAIKLSWAACLLVRNLYPSRGYWKECPCGIDTILSVHRERPSPKLEGLCYFVLISGGSDDLAGTILQFQLIAAESKGLKGGVSDCIETPPL